MLCRLFFQIYIKNKTEITEIDIAESKIQLISLQLNPREGEKEPTELKRGRSVRSPLKQCITADKPPYQRVSSEFRQAHSRRIPSFPIAVP